MRSFTLLSAFALIGLATSSTVSAQTPTPENTVITNTASVRYTDSNSNVYTVTSAAVTVTVGFTAGVTVTSPGSVTPAAGSSSSVAFTLRNGGNGADQFSITAAAADAGLTVTGYRYGVTTYTPAQLATLNTDLAAVSVAAGGSLTIEVLFDVGADRDGETLALTLTAASVRTPATTGSSTTQVQPPTVATITVVADEPALSRVPGSHTTTFTLTNNGSAAGTFNISFAYVGGITASPVTPVTIAAGANATVTVSYNVAATNAPDADITLTLIATERDTPAITANDAHDINVTRPSLTITKVAVASGGGALPATVPPGMQVRYNITIVNTGNLATEVGSRITDVLPAELEYISAAGDTPAEWTITEASGTVTATLNVAIAPAGTRTISILTRVR